MIAREVVGLLALILGGAIALIGFIEAGWWSLPILGGSAAAMLGLAATTQWRAEQDDDEDAPPS